MPENGKRKNKMQDGSLWKIGKPFLRRKMRRKGPFLRSPASKRKEIQNEFDKLAVTFISFAAEEANGK